MHKSASRNPTLLPPPPPPPQQQPPPPLPPTNAATIMLLGEDRHGTTQAQAQARGAPANSPAASPAVVAPQCCPPTGPLGLHVSGADDQSESRPRLGPSVNGGLVMDVARKPRRDGHWVSAEPLPTRLQAIRCTVPACTCDCFCPGKGQIRACDTCKHGWVAHALDKLGFRHLFNCNQVEIVQPNIVFDIASLMLYGCQATPVRLKILLDRLFSVLQHEEVLQVLHGFGWKYEDYARGYILQDSQGNVLDRWSVASRDEELLILQQFLRFGETRAITQHILLQETTERPDSLVSPMRGADSDIKKFIERTNRAIVSSSSSSLRPTDSYYPGSKSTPLPTSQASSQLAAIPLLTSTPNSNNANSTSGNNNNSNNNSNANNNGSSKSLSRIPSVSGSGVAGVTSSAVLNLSPNGSSQQSFGSPVNCTSPLSMSPLNRLQSMQPYDFRRSGDRVSPDSRPLDALPSSTLHVSAHARVTSPPVASSLAASVVPPQSAALSLVRSSSNSLLATSDLSATDGCSDDDSSNMVLNLSRSGGGGSNIGGGVSLIDSVYATKKVKHLRKSANPMKRRWNPGLMSTLITNPGSGKKRVQCNVCLKTFCDKGALKIHFSAVHLREMHRCTVEGCNMMFSSRRSRNRHSANPNPKLHTPHLRRKISPHDGRSASANHLLFSAGLMPGLGNPLALGDVLNPLGVANLSLSSHDSPMKRLDGSYHIGVNLTAPSTPTTPGPRTTTSTPDRMTMRGRSCSPPRHDQPYYVNANDDVVVMAPFHKRPRLSDGDEGEDASNEEEEDTPKNLSNKVDNHLAAKGVRKRKSLNPTRCTTLPNPEDLQYVSSDVDDDSSSDTFLRGDSLENGTEKSDDFKDDDKDLDDDKSSDSQIDSKEGIKTSITPLIPLDKIKREKHDPGGGVSKFNNRAMKEDLDHDHDHDVGSNHGEAVSSSSYDESSENALKHLESLSQGNFGDLLPHGARSLIGQPSMLPNSLALPLAGMGLPGGGFRDLSPKLGDSHAALGHHGGGLGGGNGGSSPSSPLSESQPLPGMPSFRDASYVGSVEVPVDKDNPRRCIACGKIFQNHFGVKTHYQNVHLKLMHKCTVEGCNAAFPSKRSRDRHSANLNLHRKLLSTSDKAFLEKGSPFAAALAGHTLRDEFLARIYGEPPVLPLGLDPYAKLPVSLAETLLNNHHERALHANHLGALGPHLLPGLLIPPPGLHADRRDLPQVETPVSSATPSPHDACTPTSTPTPTPPTTCTPNQPGPPAPLASIPLVYCPEDDAPSPETDGKLPCKFCQKKFPDAPALKEHYEQLHVPEMFRCTVDGCNKIFTSQKKRNVHSQNEAAHKLSASEASAS